jgi:PAS domain-containing protein
MHENAFSQQIGDVMESNKTATSNHHIVKENEQLQAILDSVSSVVLEISAKGDILYANQAAVQMFGYSQAELKKSVSLIWFPKDIIKGNKNTLILFSR